MKNRKLYLEIIKNNRIIEFLQSVLFFRNMKEIFTHVQLRVSDSDKSFSAEPKGLKFVDKPTKNQFRGLEVYEIPLNQTEINNIEVDMVRYAGKGYDKFIFWLWAINISVIFIPIILGINAIVSLKSLLWICLGLVITYIPIRLILKNKSEKTYHCSEIVSKLLYENSNIDFGYIENHRTASPYIIRLIVRFAKWKKVEMY